MMDAASAATTTTQAATAQAATTATAHTVTTQAATAPTAHTATTPTVRDLHRTGELAARYPEVRAALAGLSAPELATAGLLLSRVDPDEVLRAHPDVPQLRVAITGHGTLAQLTGALTAELARHGLLARPRVSDFDSYVFDLGDPASALYAYEPDLVLCVLDPMVVFDEVAVPWRPRDVERALAEKVALIRRLAAGHRSGGRGTLVLNTLPLPRSRTAQLVDHRSRAELSALWHRANAELLDLGRDDPSVVVIDLAPLLTEGIAAVEPRLGVYAKAHLSPELLAAYAREVGHLGRQLTGRTSKVLAVDLDGTLWGGILAEDGPEGVQVAGTPRGEAFHAFQQVLKQLSSQGVLLAAVSKNDAEPVARVFAERGAELALAEDDFVRVAANWRPKPDNLRELAEALNLGVDSFVFVDDSPVECALVRWSLPATAVVPVGAEPALHVGDLLRDGWFDTRELTVEDRARPARYREELVRADFMDSFDSVQEYLAQLGVAVRVAAPGPPDVARLSQLTLRTNQFNQSTERLQPEQVRALMADPDRLVLTVRSADRFGENGMVGAVFGTWTTGGLAIDNFLLSCRVFSRGIEQAVLGAVLRRARERGAGEVVARSRETAKNRAALGFYPRHGFVTASVDGPVTVFRHDLAAIPATPQHISLTEDFEGAAR